jgi:glycosyltransferase involved in cell wall biosynthesis
MSASAALGSHARRIRQGVLAKRHLLTLPAAGGRSANTVYFLTPDNDGPTGGVRVIYRHVDLLNQAGIPAAVLHQRPGFRCTWFQNDTVVRDVRGTTLGPADLLVVGELNVGSFGPGPAPFPHVVFNQNSFLTWSGHPDRVGRYYREGPRPRAILTVSDYALDMLATAFPSLPVARLHLQIDPAFRPGAAPRDRTITYMPRKGAAGMADLVRRLIAGMDVAAGWTLEPLDGLAHADVARRLQRSQVFLSFAEREGFGLPAAEAMACGNYVVGSHGYGGMEFFDPRYCAPVAVGDVLGMVRALEEALDRELRQPGWLAERGRQAAAHVSSTYSGEAEAHDVVTAYAGLLEVAPTGRA